MPYFTQFGAARALFDEASLLLNLQSIVRAYSTTSDPKSQAFLQNKYEYTLAESSLKKNPKLAWGNSNRDTALQTVLDTLVRKNPTYFEQPKGSSSGSGTSSSTSPPGGSGPKVPPSTPILLSKNDGDRILAVFSKLGLTTKPDISADSTRDTVLKQAFADTAALFKKTTLAEVVKKLGVAGFTGTIDASNGPAVATALESMTANPIVSSPVATEKTNYVALKNEYNAVNPAVPLRVTDLYDWNAAAPTIVDQLQLIERFDDIQKQVNLLKEADLQKPAKIFLTTKFQTELQSVYGPYISAWQTLFVTQRKIGTHEKELRTKVAAFNTAYQKPDAITAKNIKDFNTKLDNMKTIATDISVKTAPIEAIQNLSKSYEDWDKVLAEPWKNADIENQLKTLFTSIADKDWFKNNTATTNAATQTNIKNFSYEAVLGTDFKLDKVKTLYDELSKVSLPPAPKPAPPVPSFTLSNNATKKNISSMKALGLSYKYDRTKSNQKQMEEAFTNLEKTVFPTISIFDIVNALFQSSSKAKTQQDLFSTTEMATKTGEVLENIANNTFDVPLKTKFSTAIKDQVTAYDTAKTEFDNESAKRSRSGSIPLFDTTATPLKQLQQLAKTPNIKDLKDALEEDALFPINKTTEYTSLAGPWAAVEVAQNDLFGSLDNITDHKNKLVTAVDTYNKTKIFGTEAMEKQIQALKGIPGLDKLKAIKATAAQWDDAMTGTYADDIKTGLENFLDAIKNEDWAKSDTDITGKKLENVFNPGLDVSKIVTLYKTYSPASTTPGSGAPPSPITSSSAVTSPGTPAPAPGSSSSTAPGSVTPPAPSTSPSDATGPGTSSSSDGTSSTGSTPPITPPSTTPSSGTSPAPGSPPSDATGSGAPSTPPADITKDQFEAFYKAISKRGKELPGTALLSTITATVNDPDFPLDKLKKFDDIFNKPITAETINNVITKLTEIIKYVPGEHDDYFNAIGIKTPQKTIDDFNTNQLATFKNNLLAKQTNIPETDKAYFNISAVNLDNVEMSVYSWIAFIENFDVLRLSNLNKYIRDPLPLTQFNNSDFQDKLKPVFETYATAFQAYYNNPHTSTKPLDDAITAFEKTYSETKIPAAETPFNEIVEKIKTSVEAVGISYDFNALQQIQYTYKEWDKILLRYPKLKKYTVGADIQTEFQQILGKIKDSTWFKDLPYETQYDDFKKDVNTENIDAIFATKESPMKVFSDTVEEAAKQTAKEKAAAEKAAAEKAAAEKAAADKATAEKAAADKAAAEKAADEAAAKKVADEAAAKKAAEEAAAKQKAEKEAAAKKVADEAAAKKAAEEAAAKKATEEAADKAAAEEAIKNLKKNLKEKYSVPEININTNPYDNLSTALKKLNDSFQGIDLNILISIAMTKEDGPVVTFDGDVTKDNITKVTAFLTGATKIIPESTSNLMKAIQPVKNAYQNAIQQYNETAETLNNRYSVNMPIVELTKQVMSEWFKYGNKAKALTEKTTLIKDNQTPLPAYKTTIFKTQLKDVYDAYTAELRDLESVQDTSAFTDAVQAFSDKYSKDTFPGTNIKAIETKFKGIKTVLFNIGVTNTEATINKFVQTPRSYKDWDAIHTNFITENATKDLRDTLITQIQGTEWYQDLQTNNEFSTTAGPFNEFKQAFQTPPNYTYIFAENNGNQLVKVVDIFNKYTKEKKNYSAASNVYDRLKTICEDYDEIIPAYKKKTPKAKTKPCDTKSSKTLMKWHKFLVDKEQELEGIKTSIVKLI